MGKEKLDIIKHIIIPVWLACVLLMIFCTGWSIAEIINYTSFKKNSEYISYYVPGSRVPYAQCKSLEEQNCGLKLFDCTSGKEYLCMHDTEVRPSKTRSE